ncbi:unnamed protein product [Rhizoctonia solani]|uniref:Pectate lyase n=1 Tax=Rhizoctonia solani TaxID=456999 RepID=A0A8H3ADH5_9AGAM|nr:unnamed protein product [Rhizoctonia solani]
MVNVFFAALALVASVLAQTAVAAPFEKRAASCLFPNPSPATNLKSEVQISNVIARNGKLLAGVDSNYGDVATIDTKFDVYKNLQSACDTFEGNTQGLEPKILTRNIVNAKHDPVPEVAGKFSFPIIYSRLYDVIVNNKLAQQQHPVSYDLQYQLIGRKMVGDDEHRFTTFHHPASPKTKSMPIPGVAPAPSKSKFTTNARFKLHLVGPRSEG